jgi:hypothetical protein
MTDNVLTIAFVGSSDSGIPTLMNTLTHALENDCHGLKPARDSAPVLPGQDGFKLSLHSDGNGVPLPSLRSRYVRWVAEMVSGSGAGQGGSTRDTPLVGDQHGGVLKFTPWSVEPRRVSGRQDQVGDDVRARNGEVGLELAKIELDNMPGVNTQELAEKLVELDGLHLCLSCVEPEGDDPAGLLASLLWSVVDVMERKRRAGEPVRLRSLCLVITQIDRAFFGRPDGYADMYALGADGRLAKGFINFRLEARTPSGASGEPSLRNLLTQLARFDAIGQRAGRSVAERASPVIFASAFGGVKGAEGINLDWIFEEAGDATPRARPVLLTVSCMSAPGPGETSDKVMDEALAVHEPFQAADGLLYLVRRCRQPMEASQALLPWTRMVSHGELLGLLDASGSGGGGTSSVSTPITPARPKSGDGRVQVSPRAGF